MDKIALSEIESAIKRAKQRMKTAPGRCQGSCRIFYKFLSSIISKNIVLWLTSLVESSSTSHPANFSLVPPGR